MTKLRASALLLCLAVTAAAQNSYVAICDFTGLSGAPAVCTVQAPTTGAPSRAQFVALTVSTTSTTAVPFTIERDGTTATATSITPAKMNPVMQASSTMAPKMTAFTASNSTTGTVVGKHRAPSGGTISIALADTFTAGNSRAGAVQNITIRTASMTGDATINVQWREQ